MAAGGDKLRIEIEWRLRTSWRAVPLLRRVGLFVARSEGFRAGVLSVIIVGGRAMRSIHRQSLGIDEPTDVLSFDYGTDRRRGILDGELILCAEVARQRAAAASRAAERKSRPRPHLATIARAELALYLTHGLLHLAGHDDRTAGSFRRMHAREDELLSEFGLGPVFSTGGSARPA